MTQLALFPERLLKRGVDLYEGHQLPVQLEPAPKTSLSELARRFARSL